ncbi:hypothetical protein [Aquipuribacter sp. MA13-6]|uniref:hypothetical protein n=1 Tax=unclassified Aquipuribacter TaxID=2635084 RepID=UPI003EEDFBB3
MVVSGDDPLVDRRAAAVAVSASAAGWQVTLVGRSDAADHGAPTDGDVVRSRWRGADLLRLPWPTSTDPDDALLRRDPVYRAITAFGYPDRTTAAAVGRGLAVRRRRVVVSRTGHGPAPSPAHVAVVLAGGLHKARTRLTSATKVSALARRRRDTHRSAAAADAVELEWGRRLDGLVTEADVVWVVGDLVLAAAAGAVTRLGDEGPALVYDVRSDLTSPDADRPGTRQRRRAAEDRHVGAVDLLVVPSPPLARRVTSRWQAPTALVPEAPVPAAASPEDAPGLREQVGASERDALVVVPDAHHRHVTEAARTVLETLPDLPKVRLVLLTTRSERALRKLRERAWELGVHSRVHLLHDPPDVALLRRVDDADLGLVARPPGGQRGLVPPSTYASLVAAGVPVLVAADPLLRDAVVHDGSGDVVDTGDARALRRALQRSVRWSAVVRRRLAEHPPVVPTWDDAALSTVLQRVTGAPAPVAAGGTGVDNGLERQDGVPVDHRFLGVGPANFAGQGHLWATAARRAVPGLRTEVFAIRRPGLTFPADRLLEGRALRGLAAQVAEQQHVLSSYTHLLAEANRPVFGGLNGDDLSGDLPALRRYRVVVGLALHGSEVRDPVAHAERVPWSPFAVRDEDDQTYVDAMAGFVARTKALVESFDGPVFVSTPDLLDDVPDGIWLPVVVDTDGPVGEVPLLGERPVVVHAASSSRLKGSAVVDDVLGRLHERGVVEYRRLRGVRPEQMATELAAADIVLDQFALGSYGVLACEAMAAGRVVVGHVRPEVHERVGRPVPIREATPDTLEQVLLDVLSEPAGARELAAAGTSFVRELHDGRLSGELLRTHLLDRQPDE